MSFMFSPDEVGYLYDQMADHLEARIRSGDLRPNTPLPAENRLANEYGVSLGTSRHAVRVLRDRGLVTVVQSKGVYVVPLDRVPSVPGAATCSCQQS